MNERLSPWRLGATLYMPATRTDIAETILHNKIAGLRSLVICLEDAVSDADIPLARKNLRQLLLRLANEKQQHGNTHWPLIFIRPRNSQMGAELMNTPDLDLSVIDGLVLPKFTQQSLPVWWEMLQSSSLCLMPTLETADVFDVQQMQQLANVLADHPCRSRIIALRIGGNDLLNVISLRRPNHVTLYDTPMGYVIKMLVAVFAPQGFALTAPVCEHIDDHQILEQEVALDICHGLSGKTVIHPAQIRHIETALQVSSADHRDAVRILNTTQAVFKTQGAMCEPATHRNWAETILTRAQIYGITEETDPTDTRFSA